LACWRRASAAPRLAWGLLNVGSPASSNSRCGSRALGGVALRCSSARLWARFALAWIRHTSSESVAPTRGGSFAKTTRTRRRVDLWSLGETRIRAFWNSPTSGDVGVQIHRLAQEKTGAANVSTFTCECHRKDWSPLPSPPPPPTWVLHAVATLRWLYALQAVLVQLDLLGML
jgi:hypothetical protein